LFCKCKNKKNCIANINPSNHKSRTLSLFNIKSIHPQFNGIVSGIAGTAGNLDGLVFNLIFLLFGSDYYRALQIIFTSNMKIHLVHYLISETIFNIEIEIL